MAKVDIAPARYRFNHPSLLDFRRGAIGLVAILDGTASWDTGVQAASWVYHALERQWREAVPRHADDLSHDLLSAAALIPEEIRQGDSFAFAAVLLDGDSVQVIAAGSFGALHVMNRTVAEIYSPGTWVMEQVAAGILTTTEALTHPLRNVCTGPHVSSAGTQLFVAPPILLDTTGSVVIVELDLFQKLLLAPVASWASLSAHALQAFGVDGEPRRGAVIKVYNDAA
jgi:hypothetical protein